MTHSITNIIVLFHVYGMLNPSLYDSKQHRPQPVTQLLNTLSQLTMMPYEYFVAKRTCDTCINRRRLMSSYHIITSHFKNAYSDNTVIVQRERAIDKLTRCVGPRRAAQQTSSTNQQPCRPSKTVNLVNE